MFERRTSQVVGVLCFAVTASQVTLWAGGGPSLRDLGWLVGRWVQMSGNPETGYELTDARSGSEEIWTTSEGGVMLGLGRTIRPGRTAFFEYLRIEDRSGTLVLVASPMGEGTTEFALTRLDGQLAVFENPQHDMPQRISYQRIDNRLYGVTWGRDGDVVMTDTVVWQLVE
jgi:hypothetical protein